MKTVEMLSPICDSCNVAPDVPVLLSFPAAKASTPFICIDVNGKQVMRNGALMRGWCMVSGPTQNGPMIQLSILPIGGWPDGVVDISAWIPRECRSCDLKFFSSGSKVSMPPRQGMIHSSDMKPWGEVTFQNHSILTLEGSPVPVPKSWPPPVIFNTSNISGAAVWSHGAVASWGAGGTTLMEFEDSPFSGAMDIVASSRGDRGFFVGVLRDGEITTITEKSINTWDVSSDHIAIHDNFLHASMVMGTAHLPIDYTPESYEDFESSWYIHFRDISGRAIFAEEYMLWVCRDGVIAKHDWCPFTDLSRDVWWPKSVLDDHEGVQIMGRGKMLSGQTIWDTLTCKQAVHQPT